MKIFTSTVLVVLSLMLFKCGSKPKPPVPTAPTPTPTSTPTPTPTATATATPTPHPSPTPFPTPVFNAADYLPPVELGESVHVFAGPGDDLASLIQGVEDQKGVVHVLVDGGGSITKQVVLKHHTVFDGSVYSCDIEHNTDSGCFLIADGVLVEGYSTVMLEPTYHDSYAPSIEVFQAQGDACCSHEGASRDVTVKGFHIKGRQTVYDGGVRSSILLGNCVHCSAQDNVLEDTGSIGITFGGSGIGGHYARACLAWHNTTSGVAAANIAVINGEDIIIAENTVLRPGHHFPVFGGGVSGFDLETNSPADHGKNIWVINNFYDYEGAAFGGVGSAIALQDPYYNPNSGNVIAANNRIIGGRNDALNRFMSNGFFIVGLNNSMLVNNYVYKTGQDAVQMYGGGSGWVIQDNWFDSTGGGGNPAIFFYKGVIGVRVIRNRVDTQPGTLFNTNSGITDCGTGNVYEGNYDAYFPEIVVVGSRAGCPLAPAAPLSGEEQGGEQKRRERQQQDP